MKNNKDLKVKDVALVLRGFIPNSIKPINNNSEQIEKIKILGFGHIREMLKSNNTDCVPFSYLNLSRKIKKDYCYIRQYDIVMPLSSAGNEVPVLYIEHEPTEKLLYSTTVIVIRAKDIIMSKYLYILLNSKIVQNKILKLMQKDNRIHRLTIKILQDINILTTDIDKINEINKTYTDIIYRKNLILEEEQQFWNTFKFIK